MKYFFDTNVLIYMFDADSPAKKKQSRALFEKHSRTGSLLLSTQVLQEFYVVVTRKLARPLDPASATTALSSLAEMPLVQVDASLILSAARRSQSDKLSFWDALIVQAAVEGSATTIYSEDMQDGRAFGNLKVANPFA